MVIELVVHKAFCQLSLGNPTAAQQAFDQFRGIRYNATSAVTWCAAFVALESGNTARAAELLSIYLDRKVEQSTGEQIRKRLLYEWDNSVVHQDAPTPSIVFPILPPTLTGLPAVAIRTQYGSPALPQHRPTTSTTEPTPLHVLALATAWSPTSGGVNTFNRQLCVSLAKSAQVTCVVLEATDDERREAAGAGVTLIEAQRAPGASDTERLSYPPIPSGDAPPDVIIGHGRWTGRAARRLGVDYPTARRVHFLHVIPEDIERYKVKEGVDAGELAEERQEIELALGADASHIAAVGPRIHGWFLWDLERRGFDLAKLIRFDPGFDTDDDRPRQPPQGRWTVLVTGRMEDDRLKGLDLAARAFGEARRRRHPGAPPVELLVRGALPQMSTSLENQMRDWADDPSLPVRAHPYTTKADRLAADLRGASLVLMPSRAEGFGLVAAESIVAGTPVLVSSASGLGELLHEVEPEEAQRIVTPVTGNDDHDVQTWSNAIESALRDRHAEFQRVAALRSRLEARFTWVNASASLLEQVTGRKADHHGDPPLAPG